MTLIHSPAPTPSNPQTTPALRLTLAAAVAGVLAAALLVAAAGCVPAEKHPRDRAAARAAPRDIAPTRVTLMLLESRDTDFDLSPDTFIIDVVLFAEFESALPVRPEGALEFHLLGADGARLADWQFDAAALGRVQRTTALGLDGYRVSLSLRAAGVDGEIPPQSGRLRARFLPAGEGGVATGETPVKLGLSR